MIDAADTELRDTKVHYLRMDQPLDYHGLNNSSLSLRVLERPIDVRYYLELYQGVGLNCNWLDRLVMPESELEELINQEGVWIYLFFHEDDPCGFVELVEGAGFVEILYFGLFSEYIGQGLGVSCLKQSVEKAWALEPEWLQLNTCELDNPAALDVYIRAGFKIYQERIEQRRMIRAGR